MAAGIKEAAQLATATEQVGRQAAVGRLGCVFLSLAKQAETRRTQSVEQ